MKTSTAAAALATLISLSSAATVTLKTTQCLQPVTLLEFTIDTDRLVAKELKSVCGLEIVKADGVDVTTLTCQAFKDAQGKEAGSAIFNSTSPALIATNPVQEGSILCKSPDPTKGTVSITTLIRAQASGSAPASSGTVIPTIGGNATVPTVTGGPSVAPSATGTGAPPAETTGAAGKMAMSAGSLAAAFAVLLL